MHSYSSGAVNNDKKLKKTEVGTGTVPVPFCYNKKGRDLVTVTVL